MTVLAVTEAADRLQAQKGVWCGQHTPVHQFPKLGMVKDMKHMQFQSEILWWGKVRDMWGRAPGQLRVPGAVLPKQFCCSSLPPFAVLATCSLSIW